MHRHSSNLLLVATVAIAVGLAALLATVGADARWVAALGHSITARGAIPGGVPFANAPSGHWPNALVLAELLFGGLERTLGDRGLMLAQLLAVGGAMSVLAWDARAAGARATPTVQSLLLVTVGALPALAIARLQLFSLILFPLLVALLRAQTRCPSRRIWLVVPLLALWSNLHGAALFGLVVVLAYLFLSRARIEPWRAASVALASLGALCLTPALLGTVSYYGGLLGNSAAQSGQGMWGPLSLSMPDVVMVVCLGAVALRLRRARLAVWELAIVAMLVPLTVHASRFGLWLLLFLVAPAASAARTARTARRTEARGVAWDRVVLAAAPVAVAALAFAVIRGPIPSGASRGLVAEAISRAQGSPVLAADGIDEQVALAGGKIWVGNPIDAFSRSDQTGYLDWLQGNRAGLQALRPQVRIVLVARTTPAQRLMATVNGFALAAEDRTSMMYERSAAAGSREEPAVSTYLLRSASRTSYSLSRG